MINNVGQNDILAQILKTENNFNCNWIRFLLERGKICDFLGTYFNNMSCTLAIMEYRQELRNKGYDNVSFIEIENAHKNKNYKELHKLLEELFLEPIPEKHFGYIIKEINKKENGLQIMYDKHILEPEMRILNIALTL